MKSLEDMHWTLYPKNFCYTTSVSRGVKWVLSVHHFVID